MRSKTKKMKEFVAKNPTTGMTICQRFFPETGERFIRVLPKHLSQLVIPQLKKTFANKPILVEDSASGWLRIKKLPGAVDDEELQKAGQKAIESITGETAFDKEVNLMKQSGFIVSVSDGGERKDGEE